MLADKEGNLTTGRRVLAGLGAGVMEALVIVTPFEVSGVRRTVGMRGQAGRQAV